MSRFTGYFKNAAGKIGNFLDRISNVFDSEDPIIIVPYRGYANTNHIYLKGRVLENEDIFKGKSRNELRNLVDSYKRFETDEIAFAKLRISLQKQTFEVTTDEEGYFTLDTVWSAPSRKDTHDWLDAEIELRQKATAMEPAIRTTAEIYFPSKNADYGIITDIDDTVLQTHVTSRFKLKMLYVTFLQDVSKRLPMEGVVKLYQAFVKGADGKRENPIFYVSHSPWNIYDLLEQFLELQKLPKGPLFLRDFGLRPSGNFADHKINTITRILESYPKLPFILLGDSAEKDTDFYLSLARKFPTQIKVIYIRKVKNNRNAQRISKLIEANSDINVCLANTSAEMISHAKTNGILK